MIEGPRDLRAEDGDYLIFHSKSQSRVVVLEEHYL